MALEQLLYRAVLDIDEIGSIPRKDWACVVRKVPFEHRQKVIQRKIEAFESLKPYEGCWCSLDHNIPMRMLEINKPPRWSFFGNGVDMWDWFQLGNTWEIWLPQTAL